MLEILYIALIASSPSAAADAKDSRLGLNKVICKTSTTTGSRLSRERVCMTRKQWDELALESQKVHQNATDKAVVREAFKG